MAKQTAANNLEHAEKMAAHWLYLANMAAERGDYELEKRHLAREQKWHDIMNNLLGLGEDEPTPAPAASMLKDFDAAEAPAPEAASAAVADAVTPAPEVRGVYDPESLTNETTPTTIDELDSIIKSHHERMDACEYGSHEYDRLGYSMLRWQLQLERIMRNVEVATLQTQLEAARAALESIYIGTSDSHAIARARRGLIEMTVWTDDTAKKEAQ